MNLREREKKSKLMKVCVDRTRSTLNRLQHRNRIQLTNDDSSTSTAIDNDDDSQASENMKMPALSSSNEKNKSSPQKDDVSSENSQNSDSLL